MRTIREAAPGLALAVAFLLLPGCQSGGPVEPAGDGRVAEAGLLDAPLAGAGDRPFRVRVRGGSEPLPAEGGTGRIAEDGKLRLEVTLEGTEPVSGISLGLVTPAGDRGAAAEVVAGGELGAGSSRTIVATWTPRESGEPVAISIAYDRGGVRQRAIVPLGPAGALALVGARVAGEEGLPAGAGRWLDRETARALGYDVLLGVDESKVVELEFGGATPRAAIAAGFEFEASSVGGVRATVIGDEPIEGRGRRLRILFDTAGSAQGVAEFRIRARALADGAPFERSWRLAIGIAGFEVREDAARLRFEFVLPSGARGTWDGPSSLADRGLPTDLDDALDLLRDRALEDLPAAFAASRVAYVAPAGGAESAHARELAVALGGAAGYAYLRTQLREDLRRGMPDQPALGRALAGRAGDLGYGHGPAILGEILGGRAPGASIDLSGAEWAGDPPALDDDEFEPFVAGLAIRPRSARWADREPVAIDAGARIEVTALPLAVAFDASRVPERGAATFELVLAGDLGATTTVETRAAGDAVEFFVARLAPGTYRAGVVVRWPSGRTAAGPSISVEVTAAPAPDGKELPDDLLQILSSDERARLSGTGSFQKIVGVQTEGRFRLVRKEIVVERGKIVESGEVTVELVSARFDDSRGETIVEIRMLSRASKKWNLAVSPRTDDAEVAAGAPAALVREVSVDLQEGKPEVVSFRIPGKVGQSFTLLEHRVSGSPTADQGRLTLTSTRTASLPGTTRSLDAVVQHRRRTGRTVLRTIRLDEFLAAGGDVRLSGTGGPRVSIEVVRIPATIGRDIRLLVPAGTRLEGGGDIQALVLPADVVVDLSRGPGAYDAAAFCIEEDKPFPGGAKALAAVRGGGEPADFSRRLRDLVDSGAYDALERLGGSAIEELLQVLVWAFLQLEPGAGPSPELHERLSRSLPAAIRKFVRTSGLSGGDVDRAAADATDLFLDALMRVRGVTT